MKIEVKITDEAGNVQQYVVSGSLPTDDDIEKVAKGYDNAMSSIAEDFQYDYLLRRRWCDEPTP